MPKAFISHSTPDDGYVAELESFVRALGYDDVFNDVRSIAPDDRFWPEIEKGITASDALIVVISSASIRSPWVQKEVEFARGLGKKVVPIWIEDCEVPPSFADRDVIDFRPKSRVKSRKLAGSRILRHSPPKLFGREAELAELDAAWDDPNVNVYSLVAWGGVGKTSLVSHWVGERFLKKGWPGVERYFDWSFYSQGTGESRQTSADLFIAKALEFFGDPDPVKGSAWERGERLAGLIRQHRTLLVLDGIEPLQYPISDPQAGRLKDPGLDSLLQGLAADNPGLCVVTTREHLTNIESLPTTREKKLDKLSKSAAIGLLRHLQVVGSEEDLAAAWKDAGGHALTLQLLGRFLADAHGGDIRRRNEVHFEEIDAEHQGRSAFKVMIAYEKWLQSAGPEKQRELAILRLTGLFDRPITPDCLAALRAAPAIPGLTDMLVGLKDAQWNIGLSRLLSIDLLSQPDNETRSARPDLPIDAHPLIREYFASQLKKDQPEAFKAAHSRLFDHLCKNTSHRPDDLPGLAPLYQAVVHGCLAGRHQEACDKVYIERILRGTGHHGNYTTFKLGAVGADMAAVATFFDEPWSQLSPNLIEVAQAWLLNEAALRLQSLGRLTEAVEPMREGLGRRVQAENWLQAAISASNLSELEVTLGRLRDAVADARRSVEFADRSGDAFQKLGNRTTAADALHQAGERAEAEKLFVEAERMQAKLQPKLPLLYSLQGFRYIDLILAPAERAAWQCFLLDKAPTTRDQQPATTSAEAERRAKKTIERHGSNYPLLTIALDYLTLARSRLYRSLLDASALPVAGQHIPDCATALAKLREANNLDEFPKALLTAALHSAAVLGQAEEARRYLAEAQQIAERGPMPLFLADVHLHRARMFKDKAELTKAAEIIHKVGYGRRYEELADAEEAAKGW